jgi:hypothetical protein
MHPRVKKNLKMEETNTPVTSTKGKGLGVAGMVIGIVALVWAVIPLFGAGAWWLAIVGLVLSVVAFFMAKGGNNPKKGMIIAGIVLGVAATSMSFYRVYQVKQALDAFKDMGNDFAQEFKEEMKNALDSLKDEIKDGTEDVAPTDTTSH